MSIEVKNLSYVYHPKTSYEKIALNHVSLQIEDSEFVGIVGHTGCGKSTLIQLIAGLLSPTSGQVMIDGQDINEKHYERSILRRQVGIVFQYPEYQLFETTVEKDVSFVLKNNHFPQKDIKRRVQWALETMGFVYEDIRKKSPLSLSGGEKRRVAIAGVIALKPKIMIFDEPFAGLDPYSRIQFIKFLKEFHQQGTTIIIVSHNIDLLSECVQRVIVFDQGEKVADETREIFHQLDFLKKHHVTTSQIRILTQKLYDQHVIEECDILDYQELLNQILLMEKFHE